MSDGATKKDIEQLESRLDQKIEKQLREHTDEILGVVQAFMVQVDARFNKLEERMDKFEQKLEHLTNTLDGFLKRVEDAEIENAMRDRQFERLLAWARKVSKKTGIPLEDL